MRLAVKGLMSELADCCPPEVYHILGPMLRFKNSVSHLTDPPLNFTQSQNVHSVDGIFNPPYFAAVYLNLKQIRDASLIALCLVHSGPLGSVRDHCTLPLLLQHLTYK